GAARRDGARHGDVQHSPRGMAGRETASRAAAGPSRERRMKPARAPARAALTSRERRMNPTRVLAALLLLATACQISPHDSSTFVIAYGLSAGAGVTCDSRKDEHAAEILNA